MAKFRKRLSAIFLSVCFMSLSVSSPIYANEIENLLEAADRYELKDVSINSIPEGITPVVINSTDELIMYMNSLENIDVNVMSAANTRAISMKKTALEGNVGGATLELYCYAECWNEGSFYQVSDYGNSGWRLTGYTLGMELSDPEVDAEVVRGELAVHGTVMLDTYLLINGLIKVSSHSVEGSYTYSLTDGITNASMGEE